MRKNFSVYLMVFVTVCLFALSLYMDRKEEILPPKKTVIVEPPTEVEFNNPVIEFKEDTVEELPEEEPTYTTMYTTCSVNIRKNVGVESEVYATVGVNTELQVLDGFEDSGWKSVLYQNETLYINGKYLSETKVTPPAPVKKTIKASGALIGTFKITHYAGDTTTSTGAVPTVGRTIAVDPRVIPYGSRVVINGHTYIAEDCGGAIKGNKIDIFVASESEAYQKGVYHTSVYWA